MEAAFATSLGLSLVQCPCLLQSCNMHLSTLRTTSDINELMEPFNHHTCVAGVGHHGLHHRQ